MQKKCDFARFFLQNRIYQDDFSLLFAEGVVFLAEEADDDCEQGDDDLARRRIPAPYLHAQLQSEVVDKQVQGHDQYIAHQLPSAAQARLTKRDVLIEPESRQQRDGKYDAQRRNVRRDGLGKLMAEY